MTQKIIIDTDPGIDDAMAIFLAGLDPRIELMALTTIFGNVRTPTATRNALYLTQMLGQPIPVAEGAHKPLEIVPNPPADFVHGVEGFGDLPAFFPTRSADKRKAHELISDLAREHKGEITLCAIGPLTNIALLLEHDPDVVHNLKNVVLMGGSVSEQGNVTPYAEANVWNDPHAADKVFAADWDVTLIGLDITTTIHGTPNDFSELKKVSPQFGGFLFDAVQFYIRFYQQATGVNGCFMHDSTAITAITDPELFTYADLPLTVATEGERIGQTYTDNSLERRKVHCALGVDANGVMNIFKKYVGMKG